MADYSIPQRHVKVTVILDDGVRAVKHTFHKTERVEIKGTYSDPLLITKGILFDIGFLSLFDEGKGSVYTEETIESEGEDKT